ncbi:DUF434 domain-containing protein [Thermococcus sp. M36]|uniref:DUF434 domain-containing protein n=1 Tax=Thermococcus sp. M36 TaxID=1638261 RepID=UPI00143CBDB7|nr:DUF434 domain-containing protein [Thermococcus sp. M36]NJE05824.1 DUF434 domain-containing protein [Thermococcus sp. M36]
MLGEAYRDLKYLLNRGYRKGYALEFIANHYRLRREERHLLARCVFPDSWIEDVRKKILGPKDLRGKVLAIDGFNVLITLESLVEGKAVLCEDGLIRDLKYQGKYRLNERTGPLLEDVAAALKELEVSGALFFYGKSSPKSGVVKAMTEAALSGLGVPGEVRLVKSPDFELKKFRVVATADVGIISHAEYVFDIPSYIGRKRGISAVPFLKIIKQ